MEAKSFYRSNKYYSNEQTKIQGCSTCAKIQQKRRTNIKYDINKMNLFPNKGKVDIYNIFIDMFYKKSCDNVTLHTLNILETYAGIQKHKKENIFLI